jgi:UPF0271 protein
MGTAVDLIADLGEGFGSYTKADDAALLEIVSSANVACGFHAGDPRTLDRAVETCRGNGVALGAHPGFADLVGFGRRTIDLSRHEVMTDVLYQIGAISAFARRHGVPLQHVAPHGRLGNLTVVDEKYASGVLDAVSAFDRDLVIVSQEGELTRLARTAGLRVAVIGFADRAYEDTGLLVDRREPGALVHDPVEVAARAVRMVTTGTVLSRHGKEIPMPCDTVLLHGDTADSVSLARCVRKELEAAGVTITPLGELV